jgi:hypothetical protein
MNDLAKIQNEYQGFLGTTTSWLRIRFTPGMEMLAQELSTGRRIFEQDALHPQTSPTLFPSGDAPEISPMISPEPSPLAISPSPAPMAAVTRRRSQRWVLDATGAFPTLFIPEDMVSFYSTLAEMKQAIAEDRLVINAANVVTVERVAVHRSVIQSNRYQDTSEGVRSQEPPVKPEPLTILEPTSIPVITAIDQEMCFKVEVRGGNGPYRYTMLNAPQDLYVTEDGWVRGFIETDQWPATGYREFLILILVEDASIPTKSVGLEFRYRLYAPAPGPT